MSQTDESDDEVAGWDDDESFWELSASFVLGRYLPKGSIETKRNEVTAKKAQHSYLVRTTR